MGIKTPRLTIQLLGGAETGIPILTAFRLLLVILLFPVLHCSEDLARQGNQHRNMNMTGSANMSQHEQLELCINNFPWTGDDTVVGNQTRLMMRQLLEANCELKTRLEQMETKLARIESVVDKIRDSEHDQDGSTQDDDDSNEDNSGEQNDEEETSTTEQWKEPPLFAAIHPGKNLTIDIIKDLIDNGADVLVKDPKNLTFLHKLLLERTFTPHKFHDLATYLISKNHSGIFDVPGGNTGATPLMWALHGIEMEKETLEALHENGVNFNALDDSWDSTLKYALGGKRSVNCLSELVELGADWKIRNKVKFNLIHLSCYFGRLEGIKFFVKKGLDINAVDVHGLTPLHVLCYRGTDNIHEMVTFMIKNGANIKAMTHHNQTAADYLQGNEGISKHMKKVVRKLLI